MNWLCREGLQRKQTVFPGRSNARIEHPHSHTPTNTRAYLLVDAASLAPRLEVQSRQLVERVSQGLVLGADALKHIYSCSRVRKDAIIQPRGLRGARTWVGVVRLTGREKDEQTDGLIVTPQPRLLHHESACRPTELACIRADIREYYCVAPTVEH